MQWLNKNRDLLPSAGALLGVFVFWVVGVLGGLGVLRGIRSPLAELIGLYLMLLLVTASVAVAYWGVRELRRQLAHRRGLGAENHAG